MSDGYSDFQYSTDDQSQDTDEEILLQAENAYYSSKASFQAGKLDEALEGFISVVEAGDGKHNEWSFKALKQVVKIKVLSRSEDVSSMIRYYEQLLDQARSVSRTAREKKVNSLLDFCGSKDADNNELLERLYTTTLRALVDAKNDRLALKTSVKLAHLYLAWGRLDQAEELVDRLLETTEEGGQLMEVYALRIQLLSSQPDRSRRALLQSTYSKALSITSAIPHPKVLGIIHQVGGKMHMASNNWKDAAVEFFLAFRSFDEAGSPERCICLKYMLLANMMMDSSVDPFDSQETRPYRSDSVVSAMTSLVTAYQSSDIDSFEAAVRHPDISGDAFVAPYVSQLRRKICQNVIVGRIQPFSRVALSTLRDMVRAASAIDLEELLVSLILDGAIDGKIDQSTQVLEIRRRTDAEDAYVSCCTLSRLTKGVNISAS